MDTDVDMSASWRGYKPVTPVQESIPTAHINNLIFKVYFICFYTDSYVFCLKCCKNYVFSVMWKKMI